MCMAMIGLGKMDGNMAHRLRCNGVGVACYDRTIYMAAQSAVDGGNLQASLTPLFQPDLP